MQKTRALKKKDFRPDQNDHAQREQEILELLQTSELSQLKLKAPFDQTIKPHSYIEDDENVDVSSEVPSEEAQVETAPATSLEVDAGRVGHSLEEKEVDFPSDFPSVLSRLPLLSIDRSNGGESAGVAQQRGGSSPEEQRPDLSIVSLLGEGGMGRVQLAEQRSLKREVAIKSVKQENPTLMSTKALLHEGQIMGSLSHPNVLPVYALGRDKEHQPVLVMKRVEGLSWKELLEDPEHPYWTQSQFGKDEQVIGHLEIFMDVCNAVAFAHEKGIIHRDIKPENVMIGAFGEVLLLDWGLGMRLADRSGLASSRFVGTPSYMAPEMVTGREDSLTIQTDIYLLGATLHHILMGVPRHVGTNVYKVIFSVIASEPFSYPAHIPEGLAALCNKATHKEPEQRFESALAFKEAVASYLRHRGSYQLTDVGDRRLGELEALIKRAENRRVVAVSGEVDAAPAEENEEGRFGELGIGAVSSECQFAYMQALQQWSGNPRAQEGVQKCFEWMCIYELGNKHLASAESYLKRLKVPEPSLVARVEGLRREQESERAELEQLQEIREELDFEKNPVPRFLLIGGISLVVLLAIFGSFALGEPLDSMSFEDLLGFDVFLMIVYSIVLVWKRKMLLSRRIDRRFFLFLGIVFFSGFVHHLSAFLLGASVMHANISEGLSFAMLCLFAGMTIRAWFYAGTFFAGLSSLLILMFPKHHVIFYTTEGLFLLFFLIAMLYLQIKRTSEFSSQYADEP